MDGRIEEGKVAADGVVEDGKTDGREDGRTGTGRTRLQGQAPVTLRGGRPGAVSFHALRGVIGNSLLRHTGCDAAATNGGVRRVRGMRWAGGDYVGGFFGGCCVRIYRLLFCIGYFSGSRTALLARCSKMFCSSCSPFFLPPSPPTFSRFSAPPFLTRFARSSPTSLRSLPQQAVENLHSHVKALRARVERIKKTKQLAELQAQYNEYSAAATKLKGQADELAKVKGALESKISTLEDRVSPLLQKENYEMRASIDVPNRKEETGSESVAGASKAAGSSSSSGSGSSSK